MKNNTHNSGEHINGVSPETSIAKESDRNGTYLQVPHATGAPDPPGYGIHSKPVYTGDVVDIGSLLLLLWRRRNLIWKTVAVVMVIGMLLSLRQRSVYQATCSILITAPGDNSPTVSSSLRDLLNASQPRSVGTQLAIMRSYPVQRAALKRLGASKEEIAQKYYKLDVNPQRDSDAIDITAESYDPAVAADLANALNSEYMWQYQQQNHTQVQAGTREVADQLAAAKRRLNEASTKLKNYKLANRTIDLGEESKARLASINQIETSLRDLRSQRAASLAHIEALSKQVTSIPSVEVLPDRIVRRPEVEALRGQLNQLELQRIATLRRYRPNSPEVKTLESQSAEIRRRLQNAVQTEVSSWTRSVNPVRQGMEQDIARTQAGIWSIDAQTRALQQSAQQEHAKEALLPEREFQLNQLVTEQSVLQQTYEVLNEKYQSLLVSEGAKLTSARTLAPAEVPSSPIRPRRLLSLIMSLMLGLALAVGLAIVIDRLDDRIRSTEGAEEAAQLPVLAQVPLVQNDSKSILINGKDVSSPLLESFRLLRTHLMLQAPVTPISNSFPALPPKSLRSVMITSSREGEGKSFCAVNLAIATALSGRSVVLIECDLRRPTLHSMLGLSLENGLTDVIAGKISLPEAQQQTSVPGLTLLSAGEITSNSTEILDSDLARETLRKAINGADFAILSCPPVPHLADAQIVATVADGALLVVGYDEAARSEVTQARELLDRTGIQLLGTVLNKVSLDNPSLTAYLYGASSRRPVGQ